MKSKMIGLWIFRIVVAAFFILTGGNKLLGNPMMVDIFGRLGLGQGFRLLTGAIEVAGAVLVLVPATSVYGALVLACVMAGAFAAQIGVLHKDWIHTVVIFCICAALAWVQRGGIVKLTARAAHKT